MINIKGHTAVICCDNCLKELATGSYPSDAEDNLPSNCITISGDGEKANKHYCNECKTVKKEEEEIEQMDAALSRCRQLIEAKNMPSAIKHYQSEMKCSYEEAIETVGPDSIFYKSVMELQKL